MKKFIYLILSLSWISFIFYNSTRSADSSSEASGFFVNFALSFFHLLKINVNPAFVSLLIRKGAHFFEFFMLAILSYNFIKFYKLNKSKILYGNVSYYSYLAVLLFCLVIASIDEYIQRFSYMRAPSIIDVIIDFSGSLVAIVLIYLIKYKKIKSSLNNT